MAASAVVGALRAVLSADTAQFEKSMKGADAAVTRLANTMKRDLEPSQSRVNQLVRQFAGTREIGNAEAYARAVEKAGGATALTGKHQAEVNRVVQRALEHYRALGREVPKHLLDLANATKQVQAPTEKMGGGMDLLLGKARLLAGAFGVTLGAGALVGLARSAFTAADNIGDLALKMGISTDAAQRFQFAARQSGAEIEDVSRAIVQMNDRLAEGEKGTIAALTAAGLKFENIRAMKPEDAFRAIADAIGRMSDPMRQTQVAMELFGKAGANILPLIHEKSLQAADQITIWSTQELTALKDARQAWENLGNMVVLQSGRVIAAVMSMSAADLGGEAAGRLAVESARRNRVEAAGGRIRTPLITTTFAQNPNEFRITLGPKFETAEERAKREAAEKAALAAATRLSEAIKDREQAILGVTQADRIQLQAELNLLHKGYVPQIAALLKVNTGLDGITKRMPDMISLFKQAGAAEELNSRNLRAMADALDRLVNKTKTADLLRGGITGKALGELFAQPGNLAAAIRGELAGAAAAFPNLLMQAVVSGQGAMEAIRASFVSMFAGIGTQFGESLKTAGTLASKQLGQVFSGLFGGALDFGFSLFGKWQAEADLFKAETKSLEAQIRALGGTPLTRGEFSRETGRRAGGNEEFQKRLRDQLDALQKKAQALADHFTKLTSSVQVFGGKAPAALRPMIESLLQSQGLTAEMRATLEGLAQKPTWQAIQERATALGISLGALGSKFSQARISDIALQYVRDLGLFEDAGADLTGVLEGMQDELSTLVQEALTSGSALPKTLEPYLRKLDEMGLLLDEDGNRIDMGALSFKDIEDEALKQVVSVLEQIRDLLAGKLPAAVKQFSESLGGVVAPRMPRISFGGAELPTMPQLAGGTHGEFTDWGPGTPVMLHGRERVMTAAEGSGGNYTFNISALDARSFEEFLRRGGDIVMARELSRTVTRLGLTRK